MYTVSFYSFKGGVGRTMALANVGARLAQTGRKVLMVDFDLEAPGLGTYEFPKPDRAPGVVDFINDYLDTNKSPRVTDYLYESPAFGKDGGRLWTMPAGVQDESYAKRFARIDWQHLYAEQDGFLLLEDLKQQWETQLQPDYVLIDSRTGHSDVVGICTRQLPDAVILMMFPNAQNLIGLRKVVSDIREQQELPGGREIKMHFVVSNVPDLDDENQILASTFRQFSEQLGYKKPSAIIHRYQSLALLNQDIFAVTRPRTRLAQEYFKLCDEIVKYNEEDREGALSFLRTTLRQSRLRLRRFGAKELQKRLDRITEKHPDDKGILVLLGEINDIQGRGEQALEFYQAAHKQGLRTADLFLSMARIQENSSDPEGALESIRNALKLEDASYFELGFAAQILSKIAPEELSTIESSPALLSMDASDQIQVADRLSHIKGAFAVSESIIGRVRGSMDESEKADEGILVLALGQINEQRYDDAIAELRRMPDDDEGNVAVKAFNLGMAVWGKQGSPDPKLFQRVVDVEQAKAKDLNYLQCLAIAHYAVGNYAEAERRALRAKRLVVERPMRSFSAWSYDEVSPRVFKSHLIEIQKMVNGENVEPEVFRKTKSMLKK